MPTDEELERMRELAGDSGNESDEDSEPIGDETDDVDGGEDTDESVGDGPEPVAVEAVEEVHESGGIPLPVSTTTLYAGVALLLVAMFWYSKRGNSEPSQESEQDDGAGEYGGLISPTEGV